MKTDHNLNIFSEAEKFALYGFPDFNSLQRKEYFHFSTDELVIIMRSKQAHVNACCALQMGYFKAKKMFFAISLDNNSEDLQFIMQNYFPNKKLLNNYITNYEYYTQQKEIAQFFGYQLWSKEFLTILDEQASIIIKRDISPNFIARKLIVFLEEIKVVRPAYTTLQFIISNSLSQERYRIRDTLNTSLTIETKLNLDKLMKREDNLSKLAAFKQDAKNFGFKMMLKERQKQDILEPLYEIAKEILPKLDISMQNIDHYVNLANHYTIYELRELKSNQNYLYLLCYAFKRHQQINDNLIEALIYHVKKFDALIKSKTDKQFTDNETDLLPKIAKLLLLYVDETFNAKTLFNEVCEYAFNIMSEDEIKLVGQKMLNKRRLKQKFKWQEIDKAKGSFKKCLRPLFMKLNFSSEQIDSPWTKAINWLQNVFTKNQKLSDRSFDECPNDTIPKYLQSHLLVSEDKDKKTINSNRYEYWIYRQIQKQLATGELYVANSINYRCFYHELVDISKQEEVLKKLNIPWLLRPIETYLNNLGIKLDNLWVTFNNGLRKQNFKHLTFDDKKQKLHWNKVKTNNNEAIQKKFYKQFSCCNISDILHFVDNDCHFLSAFVPLQPRYSKQGVDKNTLVATILAQAFNYGNYKMSQTSDISYGSLENTYQQYLRLATLKAANDMISNSIGKLKIFEYYSFDLGLIYSSVDGQKYALDTPNIKGRHSKKYLREGQGVSAYTLSANHVPLQCELIGSHEHESYYVFDIWYNNTSDIAVDIITGDMHSINKANFALLDCFGVQLKPRFTSFNDQLKNIYCGSDITKYSKFLIKPAGQINYKMIIDQKSSMDQLVATLGLKEMTQANLIKKLCHLPPETGLRKAVFELDKLVRSIYTLEYMMDVQLQKNVHKSQNRIESYHQLRAAIARVGGKKELYGKTEIDIAISNECNRLVANAIIYYNSVILSAILEKYGDSNNKKILAKLKKISPVAWHHHIHFSGQYTFQNKDHIIDINEILKNANLNI